MEETTNYLSFVYDDAYGEQLMVRAAHLLDYTPGGVHRGSELADIGAADEIHGESGDDFIYGMRGNDVLFGEGHDDDLIGGYGHDWISGGTGQDGVLGDDGRIFTSINGTAEPLNGISATSQGFIDTPGGVQQADLNVSGDLKKSVDLTPFNPDPLGDVLYDAADADDILYGGLGDDWLHGGAGDDAISGAEALAAFYDRPLNDGNALGYSDVTGQFDEYNEFNPWAKIVGFLLNFDPSEGENDTWSAGSAYPAVPTDGDDRLFGDLGNDWLVGGTGRDNAYGGWGNDLLNVDDDHDSTNDGMGDVTDADLANNVPDTHPSYEDRAFGGAGRDRLIANTGGDRLIDWAGEFNSFLVPFAPYGLATVSRMLAPSLADFLYALSESDGADFTRGPAGDPRRGEPYGELGLVRQQDPEWQDQTGAPDDVVRPGNIPGGARDVLRSALFDDPVGTGFFADSGQWTVSGGELQVSADSKHSDAVSVFHIGDQLPGYFEIQAKVKIEKPNAGWKGNAYVIFDYQHEYDFKFAGIDEAINKLVVGHRDESGWYIDNQGVVPGSVKPGKFYNMLVAVNGVNVTILIDNKDVFTHTYQPRIVDGWAFGLNYGYVGVGSDNSRGTFDNIRVQVLPPELTFDHLEDFKDGAADLFTGSSNGLWSVESGRYRGDPNGTTGMSLLNLGPDNLNFNSVLELSARVNTQGRAGFIFDRYGEESFKFVAIEADDADLDDQGRLIIGHYTKKGGWVDDAFVDTAINPGLDYILSVTLKGSTVSANLNAASNGGFQALVGHVFNAATVDGSFGLLAIDGIASFDDVEVKTDDPVFLTDNEPLAATTAGDGAVTIVPDQLGAVVAEAKRRVLASIPVNVSAQSALNRVNVEVADLGGLALGRINGDTITLDDDAAGHGWFVDSTPEDDSEFKAKSGDVLTAKLNSDAFGRMDLLSALVHEMGHAVGLTHDSALPFMASDLEISMRMAPDSGNAAKPTKSSAKVFDESRDAFVSLEEAELLRRIGISDRGSFSAIRNADDEPYLLDFNLDDDEDESDGTESVSSSTDEGQPLSAEDGEQSASEEAQAGGRLSSQIINWTSRFTNFLSSGLRG